MGVTQLKTPPYLVISIFVFKINQFMFRLKIVYFLRDLKIWMPP